MGLFDFLKKKEQYVTSIQPVPTIQTQDATVREAAVKPGTTTVETININPKTVAMLHRSFIAFDVETTGLSPESDRIIELGAVRFEDGKPVEEFNTLVNPRISIPKAATAVNHITNDMIAVAPDEKEVYAKLLDFLGDAVSKKTIMCAHNASFDFRFLANTLIRLGYDGKFLYIDTLNLSRKYIKGLDNS